MKNIALSFLTLLLAISGFAQGDVRAKRMIVNEGMFLKDRWIDEIKNDTANAAINEARTLMTTRAIRQLLVGITGTKWYSGITAPDNATGKDGDFYVNTLNKYVYTKIDSEWTLLFIMHDGSEGGLDSLGVISIIASLPGIPAENIGPYDTAMVNTGNGGFGMKTFKNFGLPEANAIVAYRGASNGIMFSDADGRSSTDTGWMRGSSSQRILSYGKGSIIDLYNSESQTTNYQRLRIRLFDSTAAFHAEQNGTSARLPITFLGAQGSIFRVGYTNADSAYFLLKAATNSGNPRPGVMIDYDLTNTTGTLALLDFSESKITGTGTAGFNGIRLTPQRASLGSGSKWFLRMGWANQTFPTQSLLDTLLAGITHKGEFYSADDAVISNMSNLTGIWGDSSGYRILVPFSRFESGGGISNPMTSIGDIIVGGASGTPTRLGKGTDGQILKMISGNVAWGTDNTGGAGGDPSDGDKGDISVNSGTWTIDNGVVTNAKQATMPTKTYKGNTTGSTAAPTDVPVSTLKSDLNLVKGDVGLANVDNTSDATKNSATATLTNKTMSGGNNTFSNIPQSAVTALLDSLTALRNRITALQANVTISYAVWQDGDSLRFDFGGADTAIYHPEIVFGSGTSSIVAGGENVSSISTRVYNYKRTGKEVEVWGTVLLFPTAASTYTAFKFSAPITVDFANGASLTGSGAVIDAANNVNSVYIINNQDDDAVLFAFTALTTSLHTVKYKYTYMIP